MVDIVIGLFILCFLYLGYREGLVKTLGSILIILLALFLATAVLGSLNKVSPEFANPQNVLTICTFIVLWAVMAGTLDIMLGLALRKIITITVLGPLDKLAGLLLGVFKGMLIAGIILQFIFYFPISAAAKKTITDSITARFSITAYKWIYPMAKKWTPVLGQVGKENLIEKIQAPPKMTGGISKEVDNLKKMTPEGVMENVDKYQKAAFEREKIVKEILKDQKLIPSSPAKRSR